ncbi:hypothetical protein ID0050_15000 [Helicobacter pylori]
MILNYYFLYKTMPFIVSVNSLFGLKKAFFKYLIRTLKDYPIHVHAYEQAFKDKLRFKFCDF